MMRTHQSGFTLVELLIVSLLTSIVLVGVYDTLQIQEKSYEVAGLKISGQESLRTGLGILESELREVGAIGGAAIGGTDIVVASSDSVVVRAQRKIGFICKLSRGDHWAVLWTPGELFEAGDSLLLFVDGDSASYADDRWDVTVATGINSSSETDCADRWPDATLQYMKLENHSMTGVQPGSPVRSFERVTYSLYDFGSPGWGLGRNRDDDPNAPAYLVGGLAPRGEGLQFEYFTPTGAATNDPTQVARIRITVRTDPRSNTDIQAKTMTTNLFLRNN